jgi:hypothetical protein
VIVYIGKILSSYYPFTITRYFVVRMRHPIHFWNGVSAFHCDDIREPEREKTPKIFKIRHKKLRQTETVSASLNDGKSCIKNEVVGNSMNGFYNIQVFLVYFYQPVPG